jgi:hypothetical protein
MISVKELGIALDLTVVLHTSQTGDLGTEPVRYV